MELTGWHLPEGQAHPLLLPLLCRKVHVTIRRQSLLRPCQLFRFNAVVTNALSIATAKTERASQSQAEDRREDGKPLCYTIDNHLTLVLVMKQNARRVNAMNSDMDVEAFELERPSIIYTWIIPSNSLHRFPFLCVNWAVVLLENVKQTKAINDFQSVQHMASFALRSCV